MVFKMAFESLAIRREGGRIVCGNCGPTHEPSRAGKLAHRISRWFPVTSLVDVNHRVNEIALKMAEGFRCDSDFFGEGVRNRTYKAGSPPR